MTKKEHARQVRLIAACLHAAFVQGYNSDDERICPDLALKDWTTIRKRSVKAAWLADAERVLAGLVGAA